MRTFVAMLLVLAVLPVAGCRAGAPARIDRGAAYGAPLPAKGDASRTPDPRLTEGVNGFGFRLLGEMGGSGPNKLLSPLSVSVALAMTANGATGETRAAMEKTLGIGDLGIDDADRAYADLLTRLETKETSATLAIADSLWVGNLAPVLPEFLSTNRDFFAAEVTSTDFKAAGATDRINEWVAGRTGRMIPKLLGAPLPPTTIVTLVNAMYFKADWVEQFDPKATEESTFTLPLAASGGASTPDAGVPVRVPLMRQTAKFGYLERPGFKAARMPYADGERAMYVFVPDDVAGLPAFLEKLDTSAWDGWMRSFAEREVAIRLPKMKVRSHDRLTDPLKALGMGPAFVGGFDGIVQGGEVGGQKVAITDVVHAVAVDVDEKGTKAAAATNVVVGLTSAPAEPAEVIADHPFFFAIRDEASGVILFEGAVTDPRT